MGTALSRLASLLLVATLYAGTASAQTTITKTDTLTAAANLTVSPLGDVVFAPTGLDVYPQTNYANNLGLLANKWLSLHAAELWVETLVAQDTMATIGGRVLVLPTTTLTADIVTATGSHSGAVTAWTPFGFIVPPVLTVGTPYQITTVITALPGGATCSLFANGAGAIEGWTTTGTKTSTHTLVSGDTTFYYACSANGSATIAGTIGRRYLSTKHNNLANGDVVYLESGGKVEFMTVKSDAGGTGPYTYTVVRDADGTGMNTWYAGDAVANTGTTGDGFMDLYSARGVKSASEYGPTIVGNVRTGSTYNAWSPRWAVGELNGLYGYSGTTYGFAAGDSTKAHISLDDTNGLRARHGSTTYLSIDTSGNALFAGSLTVGAGRNMLNNTEFRVSLVEPADPTHAWRDGGGNDGLTWTAGRNLTSWYPAGGGAAYIAGAGSMPASTYHVMYGPWVPVVPGARYEYSAYVGLHRVDVAHVAMAWYTTAGAYISAGYGSPEATATGATAGGTRLDGYGRAYGFWMAPATAAYAMPYIMVFCTTVGGCDANPYLFLTRPYLGEAGSGQTTPTPWGPGGSTVITGNSIDTGTITADKLAVGGMGGWTIDATKIAKDTGTDSTSAGLAPADYPFYAGKQYASRATAPFRVTPAGALYASNATVGGVFQVGDVTLDEDGLHLVSGSDSTVVDFGTHGSIWGTSVGMHLYSSGIIGYQSDEHQFQGPLSAGVGNFSSNLTVGGFTYYTGANGIDADYDPIVRASNGLLYYKTDGVSGSCAAGIDAIAVESGIVTGLDCTGAGGASQASLRDELDRLRAEVATLRAVVADLKRASPGLKYAAVKQ